jgi:ribonuclease HI
MSDKSIQECIRIFVDGAGQRPDGKASGFAWLREESGEEHIERVDGLSNNEAEYSAVISALKTIPHHSSVLILTDSLLVVSQLRGEYRILHPKMLKLANEVKTIVEQMKLNLELRWIPRQENRAGKLLQQPKSREGSTCEVQR